MKKLEHKLVSHRGMHNSEHGVFENSLESFIISSKLCIPIELDIWLTSDDELVVNHDPIIDDLIISESTYSELISIRPWLVKLSEVFISVDPYLELFIEVKSNFNDDDYTSRVSSKLSEFLRSGITNPYVIVCMNPDLIKKFHNLGFTKSKLGLIAYDFESYNIPLDEKYKLQNLFYLEELSPMISIVSYGRYTLNSKIKSVVLKNKLKLVTWTYRNPVSINNNFKDFSRIIFEPSFISDKHPGSPEFLNRLNKVLGKFK